MNSQRSYRLSSGLTLHLINQPSAIRAAALVSCATGSHQEPKAWPGLAHLVEHLLFLGGERYTDQQRLMPWVQGQGGRINATTLQNRTAYFFEVEATHLWEGVARLLDMLRRPSFSLSAIEREIQVIEAEYQLLIQDPRQKLGAAQQSRVNQPRQFQDFHIGNAESLAKDLSSLKQAIQQFWQQGYRDELLQLWIITPLPMESALDKIYRLTGETYQILTDSPVLAWAKASGPLQLETSPQQLESCQPLNNFSWLLQSTAEDYAPLLTILEILVSDAAPGGFSAVMRRRYGEQLDFSIQITYQEETILWFGIEAREVILTCYQVAELQADIHHWLTQLQKLSFEQLDHYWRLARQGIQQQPLLEQVKSYAFNRVPSKQAPSTAEWQTFIALLLETQTLLVRADSNSVSAHRVLKGFNLGLEILRLPNVCQSLNPEFTFYPLSAQPKLYNIEPLNTVPIEIFTTTAEASTLILRPAPYCAISTSLSQDLSRRSQTAISLIRHYHGEAQWIKRQGIDYLILSTNQPTIMLYALEQLTKAWCASPLQSSQAHNSNELLIRELIAALPEYLSRTTSSTPWLAFLSDSQPSIQPLIAQRLALLPITWQKVRKLYSSSELPNKFESWQRETNEHALLVYLPISVTSDEAKNNLEYLARCYETAFYQWLREDLALGYAVFCRYQPMVDYQGIMLAVQSPHCHVNQLTHYVQEFFERVTPTVEQFALNMSPDTSLTSEPSTVIQQQLLWVEKCCGQNIEDSQQPLQDITAIHHYFYQASRAKTGVWLSADQTGIYKKS